MIKSLSADSAALLYCTASVTLQFLQRAKAPLNMEQLLWLGALDGSSLWTWSVKLSAGTWFEAPTWKFTMRLWSRRCVLSFQPEMDCTSRQIVTNLFFKQGWVGCRSIDFQPKRFQTPQRAGNPRLVGQEPQRAMWAEGEMGRTRLVDLQIFADI